jgi:hypothetical protein
MSKHINTYHEEYVKATMPEDSPALLNCPCCSGKASLFQFSEEPGGATSRVVMCAYSFGIGGQDDIVNEGCLLYMPPEDFYRATAKAAIKYWNDFASGLVNLRLRNEKKIAGKAQKD